MPYDARALCRMVDANANRACEGLRVCEDLLRFGGGARRHVQRVRRLRHALQRRLRALPLSAAELARTRDSRRDVGRRFRPSPVRSARRLLLMNLQRVKEALRVLEESCRVLAPSQSGRFHRLRFEVYDVERVLLLRMAALRHLGR